MGVTSVRGRKTALFFYPRAIASASVGRTQRTASILSFSVRGTPDRLQELNLTHETDGELCDFRFLFFFHIYPLAGG